MEDITCSCGSVNDYCLTVSGPHQRANCNQCDAFIKFVSQGKEPCLYFGKYKEVPIKDIEDIPYLQWALINVKMKDKIRQAITNQISTYKHLSK